MAAQTRLLVGTVGRQAHSAASPVIAAWLARPTTVSVRPLALYPRFAVGGIGVAMRPLSISRFDWPSDWVRQARVWEQMDSDTQMLWRVLGWTGSCIFSVPGLAVPSALSVSSSMNLVTQAVSAAAAWERGECPQEQMKCWDDLSDEQRRAATELGYDRMLWDAEDKSRVTGAQLFFLCFVSIVANCTTCHTIPVCGASIR